MKFDLSSTSSVFTLVIFVFSTLITILAGLNIRQIFHKKELARIKDLVKQQKDGKITSEQVDKARELESRYHSQRFRLIWVWTACVASMVMAGSNIADAMEDRGGDVGLLTVLPWGLAIAGILGWVSQRTYRHYQGEFLD